VTVTDALGASVLTSGAAAIGTDGTCTRSLPAASNTQLAYLTAVWVDAATGEQRTTHVEVVGGFYFTVAQARASDPTLGDAGKYSDADVIAARRQVEEEFETITRVGWVPRYRRDLVTLTPAGVLFKTPQVRTIRSMRSYGFDGVNYTDLTATQLGTLNQSLEPYGFAPYVGYGQLGYGMLGYGLAVYSEYEHGFDRPPADLRQAALTRLRHRLNYNRSAVPDRATTFAIADAGTYSLATGSVSHTGIDEIDQVLDRYTYRFASAG